MPFPPSALPMAPFWAPEGLYPRIRPFWFLCHSEHSSDGEGCSIENIGSSARHLLQASGFRLQASGFRLQASGFRLQASGFRLQASGFRLQLQASGFRLQASGFRLQASGFRLQASGFRLQASGFRLQASGFRLQASGSGFRLQASGFRLQASGFRLQASGFNGLCKHPDRPVGVVRFSLGHLHIDVKRQILRAIWDTPTWCIVVKIRRGFVDKNGHKGDRRRIKPEGAASIRASISFPSDVYEILKQIARKKKVSLAWVVRDAVEQYIAEREEELGQK